MKVKHIDSPNNIDYLTIDEAANELGIKPTAIRNYLNLDKMTTYKFKTLTLLHRPEIDSWKARQK